MKKLFQDGAITREVEILGRNGDSVDFVVDGSPLTLRVEPIGDGEFRLSSGPEIRRVRVTRADRRVFVTLEGRDYVFETLPPASRRARREEHHDGEISMPMPGKVVRVHVADGDTVSRGQPLVVVEAMKMEHTLRAPRDGVVRRLTARTGELVDAGTALLEVTS